MDASKLTPAARNYYISSDSQSLTLMTSGELHNAFKQLVARGAQLWPDAPWQIKELVDMITEGKPMQDYEALYGRPQAVTQSLAARAKEYAATINGTEQVHAAMVARLAKPGEAILAVMTPRGADLLHGAVGVSGEAGELLDAVKKHVVYNKGLDRENIVEELGDMEFYMEMVRRNIGISREETLAANIKKLGKRYAAGYSDAAAQARADKEIATSIPAEQVPTMGQEAESFLSSLSRQSSL